MINFTYKIIAVNESTGVMDIEYSSPGKSTIVFGSRLPRQGEDLDTFVKMYAPLVQWEQEGIPFVVPTVGYTGAAAAPLQSTTVETTGSPNSSFVQVPVEDL